MTEQLKEARMSAAVKLQRAFQRQQEKSEASRRRGEELLKQARESQQKKQTNEETLDQAADRKKQLKKFKDMVDKRQIEEAATGNPGGGYHGTHVSADDRYDEIHAHVKNLTDADDKTVKHYLDSGHGTRLAGKEEDHAYIKKDFDKFMKYYRPKSYEKKEKIQEVITKDTPAGEVISDFIHSDNPKFAGKSKEKRKQMALAAYYAKQRNEEIVHEGTVQPSGTDKIEVAGNEVPANASKGKTVNQFKFFTKEGVDKVNESYDFDSAAMAKQELADVKNKKHRGRGKVANLLRKLGMKEEVEQIDEVNHREYASAGKMHPTMAKHMAAGQETDFYHSSTGDKLSGVVKHKSDKEVHIKAHKDGKMGAGEMHKFQISEELKGGQVNIDKNHNGKLDKQDFKLLRKKLKEGKIVKPINIDKVHAAGQEPHEEKWEDAKKKEVKKESFTAEELLQALKEGLWPGTPEHTAKFGDKYKQSQGGGSGIKKGSRYGGSLQKDEPDHDEDDEPKKAGRKVGSKSGARSTGTSKLINKQ